MPSTSERLTADAATVLSRVAIGALVLVALSAAVLSAEGLYALTVVTGQDPRVAWLMCIVVDGTILSAGLSVVYATLHRMPTKFPWALVLLGTAASVTGNALAAQPDTLSRVWAAVPPVILALTLESGLRVIRHRAEQPVRRATHAAATRTAATTTASTSPESVSASPTTGRAAPTGQPRPPRGPSKRAAAEAILRDNPNATTAEVVAATGADPSDVRKLRRALTSQPQQALTAVA